MEDSPLSIAASIAGLLTFVVAIIASIHVRVASLRSGRLELDITYNLVKKNVYDLLEMNRRKPLDLMRSHTRQQGDDTNICRLKELSRDLNSTEIVIHTYCRYAMVLDDDDPRLPVTAFDQADERVVELQKVLRTLQDLGRPDVTLLLAGTEIEAIQMQRSSMERVFNFLGSLVPARAVYFKGHVYVLQRMLTAGASPALIRWHRVREKVLEKVRHRDVLRAQIQSLQASMANS